jgi:hypothetical protein
MSIGNSGRIVIEIEPELKRQLYSTLAREGMTLKEWFLQKAGSYLLDNVQLKLELTEQSACLVPGKKND